MKVDSPLTFVRFVRAFVRAVAPKIFPSAGGLQGWGAADCNSCMICTDCTGCAIRTDHMGGHMRGHTREAE